jgi:hypothetical protein
MYWVNAWYIIYQYLLQKKRITPSVVNGLLFGMLSGGIGIASWYLLFKLHPKPARMSYKMFYMQLFLAHVVYIITATRLTNKLNRA